MSEDNGIRSPDADTAITWKEILSGKAPDSVWGNDGQGQLYEILDGVKVRLKLTTVASIEAFDEASAKTERGDDGKVKIVDERPIFTVWIDQVKACTLTTNGQEVKWKEVPTPVLQRIQQDFMRLGMS